MREILFRGKNDSGEWVYGWLGHPQCYNTTTKMISSVYFTEISDDLKSRLNIIVDYNSVGQFTGLTDKNGKRIFEGDVVKFTDSPFGYSYTGVVCFNEGSFCIKYEYWKKEKFHRIGQTDKWQDMGASGIVTYQYEILGNIHDNPELLENP